MKYQRTITKLQNPGLWKWLEVKVDGLEHDEEIQIEITPATAPTREELITALDRVCHYEEWDKGFNILDRCKQSGQFPQPEPQKCSTSVLEPKDSAVSGTA